jgi:hypothetical protein
MSILSDLQEEKHPAVWMFFGHFCNIPITVASPMRVLITARIRYILRDDYVFSKGLLHLVLQIAFPAIFTDLRMSATRR